MIKVAVKIQYRKEVLDTQGRAILKVFQSQKLPIQAAHYGKYIELHIDTKDKKTALDLAHKAAKNILSNELIETFELKVLD